MSSQDSILSIASDAPAPAPAPKKRGRPKKAVLVAETPAETELVTEKVKATRKPRASAKTVKSETAIVDPVVEEPVKKARRAIAQVKETNQIAAHEAEGDTLDVAVKPRAVRRKTTTKPTKDIELASTTDTVTEKKKKVATTSKSQQASSAIVTALGSDQSKGDLKTAKKGRRTTKVTVTEPDVAVSDSETSHTALEAFSESPSEDITAELYTEIDRLRARLVSAGDSLNQLIDESTLKVQQNIVCEDIQLQTGADYLYDKSQFTQSAVVLDSLKTQVAALEKPRPKVFDTVKAGISITPAQRPSALISDGAPPQAANPARVVERAPRVFETVKYTATSPSLSTLPQSSTTLTELASSIEKSSVQPGNLRSYSSPNSADHAVQPLPKPVQTPFHNRVPILRFLPSSLPETPQNSYLPLTILSEIHAINNSRDIPTILLEPATMSYRPTPSLFSSIPAKPKTPLNPSSQPPSSTVEPKPTASTVPPSNATTSTRAPVAKTSTTSTKQTQIPQTPKSSQSTSIPKSTVHPPPPRSAAPPTSTKTSSMASGMNANIVSNLTSRAGARPLPRAANPASKGLPPNYQQTARKVTSAIVALPIVLVTSYVLYDRCEWLDNAHSRDG